MSVQNEYSLLHREPEQGVLPECERLGLAFLPYFPLASGLLTGKYRRGRPAPEGSRLAPGGRHASELTEQSLSLVESLLQYATSHGHTLIELAVSWLLVRSSVSSVIAGATSPEQVRVNTAAADWKLSPIELAEIDRLLTRSET